MHSLNRFRRTIAAAAIAGALVTASVAVVAHTTTTSATTIQANDYDTTPHP